MSALPDLTLPRDEVAALARAALRRSGASDQVTDLLTEAALAAEDRRQRGVGVAHLLDYLRALESGALDGDAVPEITRVAPGLLRCDARGGVFHTGFAAASDDLVEAARTVGLAAFVQGGAFSSGQLGCFTERLARRRLVAVAGVNSSGLMAPAAGSGRILGTNPLAYSFPLGGDRTLTVDQASSAVAYVTVREAAERGESIPAGWAVDADGEPTTLAADALDGALLPFGGYKGANIAWLVEMLVGMSGANWSIDAPAFDSGGECPSVGMFVLAIDAERFSPGYAARLEAHLHRVTGLGVRPPGSGRPAALTEIAVAGEVVDALRRYARLE